jgi:hypothetical protein
VSVKGQLGTRNWLHMCLMLPPSGFRFQAFSVSAFGFIPARCLLHPLRPETLAGGHGNAPGPHQRDAPAGTDPRKCKAPYNPKERIWQEVDWLRAAHPVGRSPLVKVLDLDLVPADGLRTRGSRGVWAHARAVLSCKLTSGNASQRDDHFVRARLMLPVLQVS